jgi:hypothetical protein
MNAWLIAIIGVVYAIVATKFMLDGRMGLGISFIGYAIGNIGLVIETLYN